MSRREKRKGLGQGTVDRLLARDDLKRVTLPGGAEAYTGPGASEALQAMDAKAMTVDNSIIVSEDFDPTSPEDMALYAHEQYHVEQGSGVALSHAIHDAEETAARATEAMVFHRMAGGYEGGYMPGGGTGNSMRGESNKTPDSEGRGESSFNSGPDTKPASTDTDPDARRGYLGLKAQGWSHTDIVDKLAQDVLSAMDTGKSTGSSRGQGLKSAFSD